MTLTPSSHPTEGKRIEYIDAMRGFTMLLVVYSHIILFAYGQEFSYSIQNGFQTYNTLFITFRMPLFFFISGFILFKKDYAWSLSGCRSFLRKKAKVQLIPTIIFLALFTYITGTSLWKWLFDPAKYGYWFTVTLFEYFLIYAIFRLICNKFRKHDGADLILMAIGLFLYFASSRTFLKMVHLYDNPVQGLLGVENMKYFIFFSFGTLVKKHFDRTQMILDNKWAMVALVSCFFLLPIIVLNSVSLENKLYLGIYLLAAGLLGIITVFAFFRRHQSVFTKDMWIGRSLQYVGRRTLDIYLLHYFFLPHNIKMVGNFFTTNINPTIEIFVTLSLAILVVILCLLTSNIIRLSPLLGHWLFGAKPGNDAQKADDGSNNQAMQQR